MEKGKTKYQLIVDAIISEINSGILSPNEQFYTENKLTERFEVSRVTVRKAIDSLVEQGYLIRIPGKGVFVSDYIKKQLNGVVSFYKSTILRGDEPSTKLYELTLMEPNPYVMKKLNLIESYEKVWFIRRLRLTNGFSMIYEESYFVNSIVGTITEEMASNSIFNKLREKIKIQYAVQEIDAILADEKLADILGVIVGFPLLRVTMIFYDENDVPFELSVNYHRTDRVKLTIRRELNE